MHLKSTAIIDQKVEKVWKFLSNPINSSKWDRSIASVVLPEGGFSGLGCTVETVSPSGMRQTFQVTGYQEPNFFKFKLAGSKIFKEADLSFRLEAYGEGTKVTHEINFRLRFLAALLYPVFSLTSHRALGADLGYLKKALDNLE